jgi:hypothetical protein
MINRGVEGVQKLGRSEPTEAWKSSEVKEIMPNRGKEGEDQIGEGTN